MLDKKCMDIIINTIKQASEIDDIFAETKKSEFIDFVKNKIDKRSKAFRIFNDLMNANYFDLFYQKEYDKAKEVIKKTFGKHKASNEQIEEFINTFYENNEEILETKRNDMEEDFVETEVDESVELDTEKNEVPETEENVELDNEEIEQQEISETEDLETEEVEEEETEDSEEIAEESSVSVSNENKENTSKAEHSRDKSFGGKMALTVILFLVAAYAIRPTSLDAFYIVYFVLFIAFSILVMSCYCVAQSDISLLCKFFNDFKKSRECKEDLKSDNKSINEICDAYKESFLLNETYNKTRSNADLYFGGETFFNDMHKVPIQTFLKIIPGTFIGFGILGTFMGFAGGLGSLDLENSQNLLNSVENLIGGLKNAFNTSIVGVLGSMFMNFVLIHPLFSKLDRHSKKLCDYLDTKFFVSEVDAMSVTDSNNRQIPFPQTMGIVLEKLEQVASNINHMGATVGDQVTQSVKATLDKTIEKIIKEEIKKLKEEINSSIGLLQECQKHLQNAPAHLKEAAEKMQAAAVNNDELFRRQNQESVEALTKTIEENLNAKFAVYAKAIEDTSEELLNIKNTLALMPEDFSNIDKSIQSTTEKLSANQTILGNALSESTQAFDKTTEISESLTEAYEFQSQKIEEMISKFTDVLNEYKETSKESKELLNGFKGMDEQIAQIFEHINENTKVYSEVIGNSLTNYLNGFTEATKGVSAKFADATDALREEVEKLNKSEKLKEKK